METLLAINAVDAPRPAVSTNYPEPFASLVSGRSKRRLGDVFGLSTFGVNLVQLEPGGTSTVRHHHSREDEFIYVLEGMLTLICDDSEAEVRSGMCAGFRAGSGVSHQLVNRGSGIARYLEVGSRVEGDEVVYPYDDLALNRDAEAVRFTHKNGQPYP